MIRWRGLFSNGYAVSAVLVFVATPLFVAGNLGRVSAQTNDVNNFTINSFDADYTLTRADRQGTLRVIEKIEVTYSAQNHGILRALPTYYHKHRLQISDVVVSSPSNAPSTFTTYSENGNMVLKIGDPNSTVTGRQEYQIEYSMNNVIDFGKNTDALYWNVNGMQWGQAADRVSVSVHVPDGLTVDTSSLRCFTGSKGSLESSCSVNGSDKSLTYLTSRRLNPGETLTIYAGFQKGYFAPSSALDTFGEYARILFGFVLPLAVFGGLGIRLWSKYGRDNGAVKTVVPQYNAPDDFGPLQVGAMQSFSITSKDITATIIDLAVRGYVRIIEAKQAKRFSKDTTTYSIELINTDFTKLNEDEVAIMTSLFGGDVEVAKKAGIAAGESVVVDLKKLQYKLLTTLTQVNKSVVRKLTNDGYFAKDTVKHIVQEVLLIAVAVATMIIGIPTFGVSYIFGVGHGIAICAICAGLMSSRTSKGSSALNHIEGLKLYLKTAEADRIQKLQGPDAAYAESVAVGAPPKSVDLFETLLPFAIVLGVEKEWAKQFESLYTAPPNWYAGTWTSFNSVALTNSLSSGFMTSTNSAFGSPSGGSGGGAGGGGGGGGGGGW